MSGVILNAYAFLPRGFVSRWRVLLPGVLPSSSLDFRGGARGKEPACQCRRHRRRRFDPRVAKIPWRRKWQPTPVLLPGESSGQRSLVGYSPRGCKSLMQLKQLSMHACLFLSGCGDTVPNSTWERTHEGKGQLGTIHVESGNQSALELTPTPAPGRKPPPCGPAWVWPWLWGEMASLGYRWKEELLSFHCSGESSRSKVGLPLPGQHSETQAPSSGGGTAYWWLMLTPPGDTGTSRSLTWRTVQPLPAHGAASVFSDSSMPLFSCVLPSVFLRRAC